MNYRHFLFFGTYELDNIIHKIVDDLIKQFNLKVGIENFFEDKAFTVLIDEGKEIIKEEYEGRLFYFLECSLIFPYSLGHSCSFCWENMKDGNVQAYWTTDFPDEELKQYVERLKKYKKINKRRRER